MQNYRAGQVADAAFQPGLSSISVGLYNPKRPASYPSTDDISASVMAVEAHGYELKTIAPLSRSAFRRHERFRTLR